MIPTLLVILVYIVGPIAILTWAVKRHKHGVKPSFGEVVVVTLAVFLMTLFAFSSTWDTSVDDEQEIAQIVQELGERYDFPVKARFADRPAVDGIAKPRRLVVNIYGVIASEEQAKVVAVLKKLRKQVASKPIVVHFLREEVWEVNEDGSRQPRRDREELLRKVRIE